MGWLLAGGERKNASGHSRCWSRRMGLRLSRMCLADKLAFALTPAWLYIPMTRWTGELAEYMERPRERQAGDLGFTDKELALIQSAMPTEWLRGLQSYRLRWVERQLAEFLKDGSFCGEQRTAVVS